MNWLTEVKVEGYLKMVPHFLFRFYSLMKNFSRKLDWKV